MIKQDIIILPTEMFDEQGEQEQTVHEIPEWIKTSAGWWGDNLVSNQEFVNGIQWLVKNHIIIIS